MKQNLRFSIKLAGAAILLLLSVVLISCETSDNGLAPYAGSPPMSKITIEDSTDAPKVSWSGGFASVVGVNRGSRAALDTSLIWLIYMKDNAIRYPVQFGTVPQGATDLTAQFGGTKLQHMIEDQNYTFWVMKQDAWDQISNQGGKFIKVDSSGSSVVIAGDSIMVPASLNTQLNTNLDNYVNIYDISQTGQKLGKVFIVQTDTGNSPTIRWQITQTTDTLVAAIGIVAGAQYDQNKILWEVYSEENNGGTLVYGKKNVIAAPVNPHQTIPGTYTFYSFPLKGLERNNGYYVWIAGKDWNGKDRGRFTDYYAYVTFKTR